MLILLAALSDAMTAVIAVAALLLGVVFIVRGPRREPATAVDDAPDRTPLAVPVSAPAPVVAEPAPQPTTFRQGAIKLGRSEPAAGEEPSESPPLAQPAPVVPATAALAQPPESSVPAGPETPPEPQSSGRVGPETPPEPPPAALRPGGSEPLLAEAAGPVGPASPPEPLRPGGSEPQLPEASGPAGPASPPEPLRPAGSELAPGLPELGGSESLLGSSESASTESSPESSEPAPPESSPESSEPAPPEPPRVPELPRWKRRALSEQGLAPAVEPTEDAAADPVPRSRFKHGSIRFRK